MNCKEIRSRITGGIQRKKSHDRDSNGGRRHRRKRDLVPFLEGEVSNFALWQLTAYLLPLLLHSPNAKQISHVTF